MSEQATLVSDYSFANAFAKYRAYLSDICDVDYTCGAEGRQGFGAHTEVFNDNITVSIVSEKEMQKADAVFCRAAIRDIFGNRVGILRADNGQGGKMRFCISTSRLPLENVIKKVKELARKYKRITLCDIDFTIDCQYITTRADVVDWLPAGTKIMDRANTTGNNCISWFEDDGKRRCKEYNKTVQIKESAGVREVIGSSLYTLVTDNETADTALEYKGVGMTRLEVTFYGTSISNAQYYTDVVMDLYRRMGKCKTYKVSLEEQWNALASKITQMMCIYHVPSGMFAYCHWWNSLTGKIQGGSRSVDRQGVLKIRSHYGFVNRPIYLLTVVVNGGTLDEEIRLYRRSEQDENIILAPGARGGLYPRTI